MPSLREIALVLIVASICVTALVKPRFGLYGYIWFAIVQPDVLAWCAGKYPFSLVLAASTLIGSLRYLGSIPVLFRIPGVWLLALLQIPVALSVVFSVGPFLSPDRYELFLRMFVVLLLIPLLIESELHIKELLLAYAIAEGTQGSRLGLYGLLQHGALLNQSYGQGIYDNNVLALAIVMLVPMCWACYLLAQKRNVKWWMLAIILTSVPAVIMANSRGASLALAATLACMIFYSKRRMAAIVIVVLALGPAIYFVGDQYFNRMKTINHYEDEGSAASRIEFWGVAIAMWQDYPMFGVGFGQRNYQVLVSKYVHRDETHVVHNTYLQMLVDSGIFAFLLYCMLLFGSIFSLGRAVRRARREGRGLEAIPMAIQISLIGYSVGCMFYSLQVFDFPYFLIMTGAAWHRVSRLTPREEPEAGELEAAEGDSSELVAT